MSDRALQTAVLHYLATHQVMTLATHGTDGVWAAAVFYVNDDFRLAFLSAAHTRHAQHIARTPQVAVTIQEDYRDWEQIKGIQIAGEVTLLTGAPRKRAIEQYQQKYPFVAQDNSQITTALAKVNWYQLQPHTLFFIDNSKGLGHRDAVPLL